MGTKRECGTFERYSWIIWKDGFIKEVAEQVRINKWWRF
jgi:hypothetical protein